MSFTCSWMDCALSLCGGNDSGDGGCSQSDDYQKDMSQHVHMQKQESSGDAAIPNMAAEHGFSGLVCGAVQMPCMEGEKETIHLEHEIDPAKYEEVADPKAVEKRMDIICTIGPKSGDLEVCVNPMEAGLSVIRCSMSCGDHEEQSMQLANLEKAHEVRSESRDKVKNFTDARGLENRAGTLEVHDSGKELKAGQGPRLVVDYSVKGDESKMVITCRQLLREVKSGQRISVRNGTNVEAPGVEVDIPVVGEREIKDPEAKVENDVDVKAEIGDAGEVEVCGGGPPQAEGEEGREEKEEEGEEGAWLGAADG